MRLAVMLIHKLGLQAGGMTLSMLRRANMLAEQGWDARVVTTEPNALYASVDRHYRSIGRLREGARIQNLWDYLRDCNTPDDVVIPPLPEPPEGSYAAPTRADGRGKRFFMPHLNVYKEYWEWREDDSLSYRDIFDDAHVRIRRLVYDERSTLWREISYDAYGNKIRQDRFLTVDGYCYLTRWITIQEQQVTTALYFDRNSGSVHEFRSQTELEVWALNKLAKEGDRAPLFIGDGIGGIRTLPQVFENDAVRVMQIHSNHFSGPRDQGGELRKDHADVFRRANEVDRVVLLTEEQRSDVVAEFGNADRYAVIPHVEDARPVSGIERDPHRVVSATRFAPEKRLDLLVDAFAKVVRRVPKAHLVLVGDGPERAALASRVTSHSLEEHVTFEPWSSRVDVEYAASAVSVLTSSFEGYALSIGESLVQGTPVVAFDVKYGPRQQLADGGGVLVPFGDVSKLAAAITTLLENPRLQRETAERGRANVFEQRSSDRVYARWVSLVESVMADRAGCDG